MTATQGRLFSFYVVWGKIILRNGIIVVFLHFEKWSYASRITCHEEAVDIDRNIRRIRQGLYSPPHL